MRLLIILLLLPLYTFSSQSDDQETIDIIKAYDKEQQRLYPTTIRYALNAHAQPYGIIIEGEIKNGDYEKFYELIKKGKGKLSSIWLRSNGGDAIEAMKIGKLVRQLKLSTNAPDGVPSHSKCTLHKPANDDDCTCASSCFLIFAGGVNRNGTVLGIHRVYQKHDDLRKMSLKNAEDNAKSIKKQVDNYLSDMGIVASIRERVFSISSKQIEFLNNEDVKKYLSGNIPEIDEWIIAKCGDVKAIEKELKLEQSKVYPSKKGSKISAQLDKALFCSMDALESEQGIEYQKYFKP